MNQLKVISQDGQLLVDSRDVAEMTSVRHADMLDKIDTYIQYLENGEFRSQDFFIKSTYKTEGNNKTYDHYLLTRKGCDMVANKMTGEKGVLFTAAYVTRFEEMEKVIALPKVPVANMQLDRITKLLDILRIGEHLFTLETDRAIRVQIAETILGESSKAKSQPVFLPRSLALLILMIILANGIHREILQCYRLCLMPRHRASQL